MCRLVCMTGYICVRVRMHTHTRTQYMLFCVKTLLYTCCFFPFCLPSFLSLQT